MRVVDERIAKGIEDTVGREASPVPSDLDRDAYGAKVRAMLAGRETDISGNRNRLKAICPCINRVSLVREIYMLRLTKRRLKTGSR